MEVIEQATADDVPQLVQLLDVLFTQEADFQPDARKQASGLLAILASEQTGRIFVARFDGRIVGMVVGLLSISTAEGGSDCWLEDLFVAPEYRGRGIGSRLIDAVTEFARGQDCRRITLLTDATNDGAIRLYERQGFGRSNMTVLRKKLD